MFFEFRNMFFCLKLKTIFKLKYVFRTYFSKLNLSLVVFPSTKTTLNFHVSFPVLTVVKALRLVYS